MNPKPFVTLKLAQTLDGCIATLQGDSKWITSVLSRTHGHQLRADSDAILVGAGTVRADNPSLSVRLVDGKSPTKIVFDARLDIALDAQVFQGAPVILVAAEGVEKRKVVAFEEAGAHVWQVQQTSDGLLDWADVLTRVGAAGFKRVLVEGGSKVAASALQAKIVDRVVVFIAPKILGVGLPSVGALGIQDIADAIQLTDVTLERLGDDVMYTARPVYAE